MAKPGPSVRARRLLALLHLLQPDSEVPLEEIAATLDVSAAEIAGDLETLSMCGVAPYEPDLLTPIFVEDGVVTVFGRLPALERAVRLSAREAQALASALQVAGMGASDPLPAKLLGAAAPGVAPDEMERVIRTAVTSDAGAYATLALAIATRNVVRIAYQATGSAEASERVIEPFALLNERGAWYVEAFCRKAGALRTFRVDRIRTAESTAEQFDPRRLTPSGSALVTDGLPLARIRLDAGEEVSGREWPGVRVVATDTDGSTIVDVPFAGTAWIARQVAARLGAAEVLSPPEVRDAVRSLAEEYGTRG